MLRFASLDQVKSYAKNKVLPRLKSVVSNAKYSHALEYAAQEAGYKNYRALKADLEPPSGLKRLSKGVYVTPAMEYPREDATLASLRSYRDNFNSLCEAAGNPRYMLEIENGVTFFTPKKGGTWFFGNNKEDLVASVLTDGEPMVFVWVDESGSIPCDEIEECYYLYRRWAPGNFKFYGDYDDFQELMGGRVEELVYDRSANHDELKKLFVDRLIDQCDSFGLWFSSEPQEQLEDIYSAIDRHEVRDSESNPQANIVRELDAVSCGLWQARDSYEKAKDHALNGCRKKSSFMDDFLFGVFGPPKDETPEEQKSREDKQIQAIKEAIKAEKNYLKTVAEARESIRAILNQSPRETLNRQTRRELVEVLSETRWVSPLLPLSRYQLFGHD